MINRYNFCKDNCKGYNDTGGKCFCDGGCETYNNFVKKHNNYYEQEKY